MRGMHMGTWRYVGRNHGPNWLTPFARGYVHGIFLGAIGAVGLMMAAQYLL